MELTEDQTIEKKMEDNACIEHQTHYYQINTNLLVLLVDITKQNDKTNL